MPLYLQDRFNADETTVGLLFMAIVIPNIFMSVLVGWISDRYGRKIVCGFGILSMALVSPFIAVPGDMVSLVATLMAFGLTSSTALTPMMPELADYVTQRGGGTVTSVYFRSSH
jgi:MFS family permease